MKLASYKSILTGSLASLLLLAAGCDSAPVRSSYKPRGVTADGSGKTQVNPVDTCDAADADCDPTPTGDEVPTPGPSPSPNPSGDPPINVGGTKSTNSDIPANRGAKVPWLEYQAEDGTTNATVIGPSTERYTIEHIEAEAIGRKAVRLNRTGDFVSIVSGAAANSIVVRLSIPDAPGGLGMDATLSLYIGDKKVKSLPVTSKYSWVYGGETLHTPNEPGDKPHTFFDEVRALVDEFPAGTVVKLQRDATDTAAFYVIDLIDLEKVAPPLTQPADLISITEFGAKPDDDIDDGVAIQKAIDSLPMNKKAGIWIPKGNFLVNTLPVNDKGMMNGGISLKKAQVRGAGMWYSNLIGKKISFYCYSISVADGGNCKFSDFSILGAVDRRNDQSPDNGFNGGLGKNTSVENVWIEHVKVGLWVGMDKDPAPTDGLIVRNNRIRNVYADGINLDNGASNSIVEHNHFRNTGDDAMAMFSYSPAGDGPNHDNTFRFNTVQMPWRASCFAIYGGSNNKVEDSVCEDVLIHSGIYSAAEFSAHPFGPSTTFKNLSLIRASGLYAGSGKGSIWLFAKEGAVNDLLFSNIDIINPSYQGIMLEGGGGGGFKNVKFSGIKIKSPGMFGVQSIAGAGGKVTFENVVVTTPVKSGLESNGAPDTFFERLTGNSGW